MISLFQHNMNILTYLCRSYVIINYLEIQNKLSLYYVYYIKYFIPIARYAHILFYWYFRRNIEIIKKNMC